MKLNDLIKHLNSIKKEHGGDLNCDFIGGKSKNFTPFKSLVAVYPTLKNGTMDKTKPPIALWVGDKKKYHFFKKM